MPLTPGSRLGPYEILAPIGSGGMGEVYRARDARLSREVAIKVLPASLSSDTDRLKRFEKEARAASALNHPAVVTIYEIGQADGVSYIAMELVAGATLRELLAEGPMPVRRVLGLGAQIAEGLAKAHASGIVHRDLKPENIMVSRDGFTKILDFGLAKLAPPETGSDVETRSPTVSAGTEPGVAMGTVGYMSPEQARGAVLDFRSDQFSLGSVLYEMSTGTRAFSGETKPEILAAIIREDPESVARRNPRVPVPLRWIIERCLAKDPAERYASTEDLARDLRRTEAHLSEVSSITEVSPPLRRGFTSRKAIEIAAALLVGAVLGILGWRLSARKAEPDAILFRRVTFQRGNVLTGRFGPDGKTIYYGASWEGRPAEVFSTRVDGTESRSMGLTSSNLLAVSPDGELLILRKKVHVRIPLGRGTLARVSISGGAPREIAEDIRGADWLRGGTFVAQRHLTQQLDQLEIPFGTSRLEYFGSAPRVSHDRQLVAIWRRTTGAGEVVVFDAAGKQVWTAARGSSSMAWHPNGEIWFMGFSGEEDGLFAMARDGSIRRVHSTTGFLLHDIAPDGRVLLERYVGRGSIRVRLRGEPGERELSWHDGSSLDRLSEDGKTVFFSEVGEAGKRSGGVYRRGTDGSPAVRISDGWALAFSEDGRWALVEVQGTTRPYSFVPTGLGQPLPLDLAGDTVISAVFLPGPEPRVVASVGESVTKARLELVTPSGRRSLGISPGFWIAAASPDGSSIAYSTDFREFVLCQIEKPTCQKHSLEWDGSPSQWSADGRYLYLEESGQMPLPITRYEIATGRREPWLTLGASDGMAVSITGASLSRDGRSYGFSSSGPLDSSLFVVEGLR